MKYIFTLSFLLISWITISQEQISFEESEGYSLGNLHQQNDWEVTEHDEDGIITNQVISDEAASKGAYAFKNGYESDYDWQWMPIFGATKMFEEPMDYTEGFTISYDVMVTDTLGADFEFTLFAVNEAEEWTPVAGVGVENRGLFYLIKDEDYDFDYAAAEWEPNQWNTITIEVDEDDIHYYINGELQTTLTNFSELDIHGFNMLHNNYGEDAYYDNIVFESGDLGNDSYVREEVKLYPNPAKNEVSLTLPDQFKTAEISLYNLIGKQVMTTREIENIDISDLSSGIYLLEVKDTEGQKLSKKLIKK